MRLHSIKVYYRIALEIKTDYINIDYIISIYQFELMVITESMCTTNNTVPDKNVSDYTA